MRTLLFLAVAVVLTGCTTVQERVTQRFAPVEPQRREFAASQADTLAAVEAALQRLDYAITRSAAAQGIVRAQSRLLPTDRFGAAAQYVFEIRLRSVDPGVTSVSAVLHEHAEGEAGGASSIPIRVHGRYDLFFEVLESLVPPVAPHAPAS